MWTSMVALLPEESRIQLGNHPITLGNEYMLWAIRGHIGNVHEWHRYLVCPSRAY